MNARIPAQEVLDALRDMGVIPDDTRRVIIDLQVDHLPVLHIEAYGDRRVLRLVQVVADSGIDTTVERAPAESDGGDSHAA